ncbi:molybdopterin oxidoreductase family protein [Anaeromyxobacter sp. Fw109-5]|uniref:molybdopterin oxidoreductase family protein n=1 Tax=Anaeromyxobacter sp. (strain Fw109-5) TaxID=404589 RepID=UPI0000ED8128|nr:molybdopterin oxidoreductase family protein [Anaeromyxobacter sp. Fw109-5]ABS25425.1 molybdopterin oxidoreductase [Anaeromyxobacter sp. Fw109-5]
MTALRSVCPFDCPDACGLLVEVEDGRAVKVRGDPEHPYSQGTLCPKMNAYERSVGSPDRLLHPLVRTGAKGAGAWRRASWEEAIALVADRWRRIVREDGAEAILPYSYAGTMGVVQRNAGHAFFHRLGASRLDRTICSPAKGAGWSQVMGATPGPDPDEALDSDLVVLWGIHAVATNLHFVQRVKEARRRGAKVLLLEVWPNETAAVADRTILVRPGSDGALALGLVHVLARDGLADEAFLAAETIGWPELRARALAEYPPEVVSRLTGVAPADIEDLARTLARARAPFLRLGSGMSRYANGAMTVRCIVALAAALGAFGRKGGGCFCDASSAQAFDLSPITREDLQPRPARLVNMNQLGRALAELRDPPLRSMMVYAANPAAVAPDQNAVLAGLAREDLFLVVHERFMTDTARLADVVLPATYSLEHADLYRSYGQYCVQRVRPVVPPPGEAKPNWEVFRLLAAAMGFEEPVFRLTEDALIDAVVERLAPGWRDGVELGRLSAGEAVRLRPPAGPRWRTRSGKIELRNDALAEPLPRHLPTHAERGPPLRLVTAPALHTLNSTFMERPELRERNGGMCLRLSPAEATARGLADGARVVAWNELGEATFALRVTPGLPDGVAVAEGVWWLAHAPGARNVNALTAQRLTDSAGGSTFYDNRIDVRPE